MKSFTIAVDLLGVACSAAARTMTVYNNCPFTVWPAVRTVFPLPYPSPNAR
jgi:hypothetical protein